MPSYSRKETITNASEALSISVRFRLEELTIGTGMIVLRGGTGSTKVARYSGKFPFRFSTGISLPEVMVMFAETMSALKAFVWSSGCEVVSTARCMFEPVVISQPRKRMKGVSEGARREPSRLYSVLKLESGRNRMRHPPWRRVA